MLDNVCCSRQSFSTIILKNRNLYILRQLSEEHFQNSHEKLRLTTYHSTVQTIILVLIKVIVPLCLSTTHKDT
jgi:hypothetical protein